MKPRIKRVRWLWIFRRWKCSDGHSTGYGKTPFDAYVHWIMAEAIFG